MNRQEFEKYINQGGKLFVVAAPQLVPDISTKEKLSN